MVAHSESHGGTSTQCSRKQHAASGWVAGSASWVEIMKQTSGLAPTPVSVTEKSPQSPGAIGVPLRSNVLGFTCTPPGTMADSVKWPMAKGVEAPLHRVKP